MLRPCTKRGMKSSPLWLHQSRPHGNGRIKGRSMTTSNTTDISQKVSISSVPIPHSALRIPSSEHSPFRIPHSDHSALRIPHSAFEIAWCGWSLPVPESWQPLKIQGTWDKGQMMIGCGSDPVVLIKWWRPREKTRDAEAWLARRFKALHALPDDEAPHPDDFDAVGWIRHLENKDGSAKTVWYGHAERAGLVLECTTTSDLELVRSLPYHHRTME